MTEWYSHIEALNEDIAENKSELVALVSREPLVKSFLHGVVQYLELVKHRNLAQMNMELTLGIDTALSEIKRLAEPIRKTQENENE
jgi:hypothetical protein